MTGTTNNSLLCRVAMLAAVLAAAVGVMLSVATSARADASVSVSFDGELRGEAYFREYGDSFLVCDRYQDRLPVGVRFSYIRKNDTKQTGAHWHTAGVKGKGSPYPNGTSVFGCSYGEHNFGEDRPVWFQVCVRHPGGALSCSKTEKTAA
jgi:hypothetical protein